MILFAKEGAQLAFGDVDIDSVKDREEIGLFEVVGNTQLFEDEVVGERYGGIVAALFVRGAALVEDQPVQEMPQCLRTAVEVVFLSRLCQISFYTMGWYLERRQTEYLKHFCTVECFDLLDFFQDFIFCHDESVPKSSLACYLFVYIMNMITLY